MEKSTVYVSMNNEEFECSYAIVDKGEKNIIIIFKDLECVIYDYEAFKLDDFDYKYLLLKQYNDSTSAYKDFMKLIGKMCKKSIESKYFKNHISEDNWMIYADNESHMILDSEKKVFISRKEEFANFIKNNKDKFIID